MRHIGNLPNSLIRQMAFQEPAEAAEAIIFLRAELDTIYAASDRPGDALLFDAVKKSQARVKKTLNVPEKTPCH